MPSPVATCRIEPTNFDFVLFVVMLNVSPAAKKNVRSTLSDMLTVLSLFCGTSNCQTTFVLEPSVIVILTSFVWEEDDIELATPVTR